MATQENLRIRRASSDDVPLLLNFIRKLAQYEKLSHLMVATEEGLRDELFGPRPAAEVLLAYLGDDAVGFALYFHNFSTFLGKRGIYLEDVFVDIEHRGKGVGTALLIEVARIAKDRGCGRLEWSVLDWNQSAIDFYQSLGAAAMEEWRLFRLTGASLDQVAGRASSIP